MTPFAPTFVATLPDTSGYVLVGVVVPDPTERLRVQEQLEHYMRGMGCAIGMVVTPTSILLLRDVRRDGSFARVGEFQLPGSVAHASFDASVQAWVDRLATGAGLAEVQDPLRSALEEHVVPALMGADVRAAGPR